MKTYFTDGSCSPNPGPGGFSVILDKKPVILGRDKDSTNIRMEGQALIAAMEHSKGSECEIHTDSDFWIKVITEWSISWEKNGWKKSKGKIKNLDLVKEACALHKISNSKLIWVKAHNENDGNELADHWANEARKGKIL